MKNYKKTVRAKDNEYFKIITKLLTTDDVFVNIGYTMTYEDGSKIEIRVDDKLKLTLKLYTSLKTKIETFSIESLGDLLKVYCVYVNNTKYLFRFNTDEFFIKYDYEVRSNYLFNSINNDEDILNFLLFMDANNELLFIEGIYIYLSYCYKVASLINDYMKGKMLYFGYNEFDIEDIYIDYDVECNPNKYLKALISDCVEELYKNVFSNKDNPMDYYPYLRTLFNGYYKNKFYK